MPKVFISYAWENDAHKKWVKEFCEKLRVDGVEVVLDQWHLAPGAQLPEFMERSIRENNFVFIICTPHYKRKSNERIGGVGYEGDVMTSEVFTQRNQNKFIPILREGNWTDAAPSWLLGKVYVDLRGDIYSTDNYDDLLATVHNLREQAPPVGSIPLEILKRTSSHTAHPSTTTLSNEDIRIEGVILDEVTVPAMDGTSGSVLYAIPFKLSRKPSSIWERSFIETWNHPPTYTSMHRPGIAHVRGAKIILDGTTMEEVKQVHRNTLKLAVTKANEMEKEFRHKKRQGKNKKN